MTCDRCGASLPGAPPPGEDVDAEYVLTAQLEGRFNIDRRDRAPLPIPAVDPFMRRPAAAVPTDPVPLSRPAATVRAAAPPSEQKVASPVVPIEQATGPGGPKFAGRVPVSAPFGAPGIRVPISPPRPEAPARRAHRTWRGPAALTVFLVAAALAGGLLAYPRVRGLVESRSVPAGLRAYVGGGGVAYAPAGEGYAVRLPSAPVVRDQAIPAAARQVIAAVHRSIVSGTDFRIVIRVADLARPLGSGLASAVRDPRISGVAAPRNLRAVTFAGGPAYDFEVHAGAAPDIRARMFAHGNRVYEIMVQSQASGALFGALVGSFRLTGSR